MKIFDQHRGTGKTYNLIKESLNTGVPILCRDYPQAKKYQEQSIQYFHEMCQTITLTELKEKSQEKVQTDLIIDDIECWVKEFLQSRYQWEGHITCASISQE